MATDRDQVKAVTKRRVCVVNRDDKEYIESWQGTEIRIPAGKACEMSYRDANMFLGTYGGNDPNDTSKPKVKNLVIKEMDEAKDLIVTRVGAKLPDPVSSTYVCNYDGRSFATQAALDAHLATLSDKMIKDETPRLQDPAGEVTCPFCGKTGLKGVPGLQSHVRVCPAVVKPADKPEEPVAVEETA